MTHKVATEFGDNWSVFYFRSPVTTVKRLLVDLSQYLGKVEKTRIPHFLLRDFKPTQYVGISLRVLRDPKDARFIDTEVAKFFKKKKLHYEEKPEGNHHAWVRKGETDSHWNRERCEILHRLSNLVVFIAQNDLFEADDRWHFAHYLINMLALHEATVLGSNQVFLFDIISRKTASFKTLQVPI